MWSNVMCSRFNSTNYVASSSASESEFKNIKKLSGIKTKRVDVFVDNHLKLLSGNLKLALAHQKNETQNQEPSMRKHAVLKRSLSTSDLDRTANVSTSLQTSFKSENDLSIDDEENWKNKNQKSPNLRRSKTSILNPHNVNYVYHGVPILKNGHTQPERDGKICVTSNTCGFDSVFSIYTAAFLDNEITKEKFEGSEKENRFSYFVKNILEKHDRKCDKEHYNNRTKLLRKIFSEYKDAISTDENLTTISCLTGIGSFFSKLADIDGGNISSIKKIKNCTNCSIEILSYSNLMPLRVTPGKNIELKKLQKYIRVEDERAFNCRKCGKPVHVEIFYQNILALEVEATTATRLSSDMISDIPHTINIGGYFYNLFAVIQQLPNHFVAHVKRTNGIWQTYDDLLPKMVCSKNITTKHMDIAMLFYIKYEVQVQ